MAKRFTDTGKWKDIWFQDLPLKYKLFWIYLLDECDNSGVWKPNFRLATFQIGEPFEEIEAKRILSDRIEFTEDGYWFIKKFIDFQYGELSESCKPHASVIQLLKKHKIKGYPKGIHTLKDKDKDKENDKEDDKEDDRNYSRDIKILGDTTKKFVLIYPKTASGSIIKIHGADGMQEIYQMNKSVISRPEYVEKYLRDREGKHLNDFRHLFSDYNLFVKEQFK